MNAPDTLVQLLTEEGEELRRLFLPVLQAFEFVAVRLLELDFFEWVFFGSLVSPVLPVK